MTFRELVYMCLDEVKLVSDDSYITEDHVLFLISKYRSFLLQKKYGETNFLMSDANHQEIKLTIKANTNVSEEEALIPFPFSTPRVYTYDDTTGYTEDFTYVNKHRFRFVGHNKYLGNIKYCTINTKQKLQLQEVVKENTDIYIWAIFEDILKAAEYSTTGDILDAQCPIEDSMVSAVQELVVKDILGVAYRPQDNINNGTDDLASIGVATSAKKNG